jgi:hypothetical protein
MNSKPVIDWVFYGFTDKNKIILIDGIHRYSSLKYIDEENNKPIDLLTPLFGDNGSSIEWLYANTIFIILRHNPSLGCIIDWYQNINKSHPVPELYMQSTPEDKRKTIEAIVKEWITKYKSHFSPALRPIMGNTNRELFIELLDKMYDRLKITQSIISQLPDCLNNMNHYAKQHIPIKCSEKIIEKCHQTGCYLFLYKNEYWVLFDI